MNKHSHRTSLLMLTVSMLIFGTIGIFRRYIPLSSGILAFGRGLIGTVFLCIFVKIRRGRIFYPMRRRTILLLLVSGAAIGFNWILLFEAYNYTSVPVATLCYYMQPTIVILLSPLLLGEALTRKKIICAMTAIVGMVLVSGVIDDPQGAAVSLKGILFGLGAAALYASVIIMNKKNDQTDAYGKTIIQLGAAAGVMIPYLLLTEDFGAIQLSFSTVLLLLTVGLVHTGIAYAVYFGSMDGLEGQSIAIFSYIDPVTALILSALILQESLSVLGIIGAVLILGAAACSELRLPLRRTPGS